MGGRLDWDDLQFFLAVARAGTLSLAARRSGVDHATVIRHINNLEEALKARLFERNPRGYNLTQTGERLLPTAQAVEEQIAKAEQDVLSTGHMVSGTVRISTLEGFGNFFLAGRLPRFAAMHPDLLVELITIQQIVALSRREADVAVTLQPPHSGRFVQEPLTDYVLFVYGSRSYLEETPPIRSRDDLKNHRFSGYIDDLIFMRGLDYLDEIRLGLRAQLQSSSLHAQMEAALAGYGLCVLPAYIAMRHPQLVAVLPAELSLRRTYWLVTHADAEGLARVRTIRRFIRQEVSDAQAMFLGDLPTHSPSRNLSGAKSKAAAQRARAFSH